MSSLKRTKTINTVRHTAHVSVCFDFEIFCTHPGTHNRFRFLARATLFSPSLFSMQFINCINIAAIIGGRNVCCSNGALINSIVIIIIIIAVHVVAVLARLWRCSIVAACCCWTERKRKATQEPLSCYTGRPPYIKTIILYGAFVCVRVVFPIFKNVNQKIISFPQHGFNSSTCPVQPGKKGIEFRYFFFLLLIF